MLGSIYIGLSGMNAYSEGLKQISNNITNINTNGYKGSKVSFANINSEGETGEAQTGQGVRLDEPALNESQGELRQTTKDLDLAIDGAGYLVLLQDGERRYIRTGSFEVNPEGQIILSGTERGLALLDANGQPVIASIEAFRTNPPTATTRVRFADNLSSTATAYTISDIKVFNAAGQSDNWRAAFSRTETAPAGEWKMLVTNGAGTTLLETTVKFINGQIDPTTATFTVNDSGANRSAIFDFSSGATSFSSGQVNTMRISQSDGYATGDLKSVVANADGFLEIQYTNNQKKSLGAIALASFRDPHSIEQGSDGLFTHQGASAIDYLTSAHEAVGKVVSRRLEASNVDLSKEFGDLILVQRGYQASSQVVSVSNDMIQQLFGIRGQG